MKKKSNKDTPAPLQPTSLTNPETQKPFPLELSAADWAGFAKKLDEALKEKTDGVHLSRSERARFDRNVELIRRVAVADEVRNYAMLEIHEAKQWRDDFRNVVDLAKSFDLSKSQFYKSIKSAEINIQMVQAGLYHQRPKGRHKELLGTIARNHRIEAWRLALATTADKGGDTKAIERTLQDYKDRLDGKFTPSSLFGEGTLPPMALEVECLETNANHESKEVTTWTRALDEFEEKAFESLISLDTWFASVKDRDASLGSTMANLLTTLAIKHIETSSEVKNMKEAIRLSVAKDPRLKRGFYHLGLYLIANAVNQAYVRKNPR